MLPEVGSGSRSYETNLLDTRSSSNRDAQEIASQTAVIVALKKQVVVLEEKLRRRKRKLCQTCKHDRRFGKRT